MELKKISLLFMVRSLAANWVTPVTRQPIDPDNVSNEKNPKTHNQHYLHGSIKPITIELQYKRHLPRMASSDPEGPQASPQYQTKNPFDNKKNKKDANSKDLQMLFIHLILYAFKSSPSKIPTVSWSQASILALITNPWLRKGPKFLQNHHPKSPKTQIQNQTAP